MSRFFFDFRQGEDHCPDQDGIELASAEEAYVEAFTAAQEMWADLLRKRQDPRHCSFEIRDAQRQLLFLLPFSEVIEVCRKGSRRSDVAGSYRQVCVSRARATRAHGELKKEMQSLWDALDRSRALIRQ